MAQHREWGEVPKAKANLYRMLLLLPVDRLTEVESTLLATLARDRDIQAILEAKK